MKIATAADLARWVTFLHTQKLPLDVSAKAWKQARTHPQNAYLFGVCYPAITEATGYTIPELHEWVCGTFFGWVDRKCPKTPRNPEGIESVPFRTTTRDENGKRDVMNAADFGKLLDTVVFPAAAKCGAYIPEPYQGEQRNAA